MKDTNFENNIFLKNKLKQYVLKKEYIVFKVSFKAYTICKRKNKEIKNKSKGERNI